ncbi:alpha/beta fold hydrolase [Roseovarius sp. S4756]|uniref:alpha/beta fold hydrolase n=1 Tax=Roseovarius maritimus TaxID=3342637 RepID=UPI003729198F
MPKALIYIALFLAVLVIVVHVTATLRERRAVAEYPPEGQVLDVDGIQVHAVVMGPETGTAPDLVLIHGASGNTRDMTYRLAPRLAERYRVIVFDRPGLGYTERLNGSGATLKQQATLLRAAAAQLGAKRPIVMGQSYGGAVALAWAAEYPEDVAALIPVAAASNPWDTGLGTFYEVTSSRWGQALVVPLITAFVPSSVVTSSVEAVFDPQDAPEGYTEAIAAPLTLRRVSLRANADQRANLLGEIEQLVPQYAQITAPTEILHGTADTTVGLEIHSAKLVDQIAGATLTRLEGMGHMLQHVAEDAVVAAIDRAAARAGL